MSVSCEDVGRIRRITIAAGKLNVLGLDTVRRLRQELDRAEADGSVEVVVVRGNEHAFCAGLDMRELAQGGTAARQLLVETGELLLAAYGSRLRLAVACGGHAVAAGAMLLLVADRRIGVEGDYKVGFSEVSQGMALPGLPVELARDRLDRRRLHDATLLGRLWSPPEAVEVGFLDRLVAPSQLAETVRAEAEILAGIDAAAYSETIAAVRGATIRRIREMLAGERR
jgi:enoyl-CoA hydratase